MATAALWASFSPCADDTKRMAEPQVCSFIKVQSNRYYTYIERDDGAEDVFALVRDLPGCTAPKSRVAFTLQASYDRKKQRESTKAAHGRLVNEAVE